MELEAEGAIVMVVKRFWIESADEWGPVGVVECVATDLSVAVTEHSFGDVLAWARWVEKQTADRFVYYATAATQKVLDRWWNRPMIDPLAIMVRPDDHQVRRLDDIDETMKESSQIARADYLMELTLCLWMSVGRVDPWIAQAQAARVSTGCGR